MLRAAVAVGEDRAVRTVTFQTATLREGRHRSPAAGVCVMELASMVAGERFSDHPACVSPVIAGFLRGYNDAVGSRRRPELKRFAVECLGTVAGRDVERRRRALIHAATRGFGRRLLARYWLARGTGEGGAFFAGLMLGRDVEARDDGELHATALALVDRLVAVGEPPAPEPTEPAEPRAAAPRETAVV
jgi:hypothetical protein